MTELLRITGSVLSADGSAASSSGAVLKGHRCDLANFLRNSKTAILVALHEAV